MRSAGMQTTASSLRHQLMRRLTLPLLLLIVLDGIASHQIAAHFSRRAYDDGLYDLARSLALQVKFRADRVSVDLPREAIEMFESDVVGRTYFVVTSAVQGVVLGERLFPAPPRSPRRDQNPIYYDATMDARPIRAVAIAQPSGTDLITVLVGETLEKRVALANEMLIATLLPQLLLTLVVVLLLRFGIQGGLAPLASVTRQIERRGPHDLKPLGDEGPAEVRPLTHALNELLRALSAAQVAQRRFVANAAHQLRTPLAALGIQAERALRESEPAHQAQALQHVASGVRRVARVAHQLLTLARAEPEAKVRERFAEVDVAALARRVTAEWVPRALEREVDLGYSGAESGVWVHADEDLLAELLSNLLDNALRYGRPAGHVTVTLEGGATVTLEVEDDGPGIPAEYRDFVFDRFVRLADTQGDGCGLGLSIVREIAALHGGRAAISDGKAEQGFRVVVSLPRTLVPHDGQPAAVG